MNLSVWSPLHLRKRPSYCVALSDAQGPEADSCTAANNIPFRSPRRRAPPHATRLNNPSKQLGSPLVDLAPRAIRALRQPKGGLTMIRTTITVAAGLAFAAVLPTLPAQAQNSRSFVSSTGS